MVCAPLSVLNAQGLVLDWGHRVGGAATDEGKACAVDANGALYVGGQFRSDTLDADPGPATAPLARMANQDVFLAKYDANGMHQWSFTLEGTVGAFNLLDRVGVDADGNVYIAGAFSGTIDFEPGPGITSVNATGAQDAYLAKYSPAGALIWSFAISGGSGAAGTRITGLDFDGTGHVLVCGNLVGVADFDPDTPTSNLAGAGIGFDIFIAKYTDGGDYVWANLVGSTSNDEAMDLAVDGSGNCYVAGFFTDLIDLDPGSGTATATTNGGQDLLLAKYDGNGGYLWHAATGGTGADIVWNVSVAANNDVLIGGQLEGTVDMDPGGGTQTVTATGQHNAFFSRFSSGGSHIWSALINGAGWSQVMCISETSTGDLVVLGEARGTQDADPGAGQIDLFGTGSSQDLFVGVYSAFGDYISVGTLAGNGNDQFSSGSLAVDDQDLIHAAGTSQSLVLDMDPTGGTADRPTLGMEDVCFFRMNTIGVSGIGSAGGPGSPLRLSPNPAADRVTIHAGAELGRIQEVVLLNTLGQPVWTAATIPAAGGTDLVLDVSRFEAGVYHVSVRTELGIRTQRLVVE